ncbi:MULTISPECIES: acyl-CoA dehydrogenase family protein [Bradyrhizobium]|uniref:acyl-CoA dehydrogenase family protein n=1 Tax=Bradyrhizobium elkanii TaxID=29448 RepID=UPI00040715F4|nr:acyl-CoA dehydrogenase family protein [Bradyrhizobium elkanii]
MRIDHSPVIAHYLEAIAALAPGVAELREQFDRDRRLSPAMFAALASAGLFRLWLPKALGGPELSPLEFMAVVEQVAMLDGSLGWIVGNGAGMSRIGGYVPEPTARRWFSNPGAFIASATGAIGEALPSDGGYRVSGRWPFGSGAHGATLFMGLAADKTNGESRLLCCYMDREAVELDDTWQVSGLRGTGSCHFQARDVFVPAAHTHSFLEPSPSQPGLMFRLPPATLFPWTIAAVPLGIARGAIETFVTLAESRSRSGSSAVLRDRETVQASVGRVETLYRSARAFLADAITDLMADAERGEPSTSARAAYRTACTNAAESASRIVHLLAAEAGAISVFESCPLERALRDIQAASQHVAMSPNNYVVSGRIRLGLDPGTARL